MKISEEIVWLPFGYREVSDIRKPFELRKNDSKIGCFVLY